MTLEQFRNTFSGAPYSFDDFAIAAYQVDELQEIAMAYLEAKEALEGALETANIVVG